MVAFHQESVAWEGRVAWLDSLVMRNCLARAGVTVSDLDSFDTSTSTAVMCMVIWHWDRSMLQYNALRDHECM